MMYQKPEGLRLLLCLASAFVFAAVSHVGLAQEIPVTLEILTDGEPEDMDLTGPTNESLSPDASQEWKKVTAQRVLEFGQSFNFNFDHPSTPSTPKTGQGNSIAAEYYSYGGGISNNIYSTRWASAVAPYDTQNDDAECDGSPCFWCDYSCSASKTTTFSAGSYGSFTTRHDNGSTGTQPYRAPSTVQSWDIYQAYYSGTGNNYLRFTQGSAIAPSYSSGGWWSTCGGVYNASCNCNDSQALTWIQGRSGDISEFQIKASSSASGSCGSCDIDATVHGCIKYTVPSTNGYATSSQYASVEGTIGSDIWISKVEADFTGSASNQVDLWLVKGNQKIHLFNNHSHSGSNHDLNFRDGASTIGNNWNNNSLYRPYGGKLNTAFNGASSQGTWTLEAYDNTNGTRHTLNYFKIHFRKVPDATFVSSTNISGGDEQYIGDGVYIDNLVVHHSLAHDNFVLQAPNGQTYDLGGIASGVPQELDGAVTDAFEGTGILGTWKLYGTSSNMEVDMFNGITSLSLSFSGAPLDGNHCVGGGSNRAFAARVYPNHLNTVCTDPAEHVFYQSSGSITPEVDMLRMVSRQPDNAGLAALGHNQTGLKLVHMGDGLFDAYDLANDLHYIGARINGHSHTGQEVMRYNQSWSSPMMTAIWESVDGSHASNGLTYALPTGSHLRSIEYTSEFPGFAPTFLVLTTAQYNDALDRTLHTGSQDWMNRTTFGDGQTPFHWKEWLLMAPSLTTKLDLLDVNASTFNNYQWLLNAGPSFHTNTSTNYIDQIDFSALDTNFLEDPELRSLNLMAGHSSQADIQTIDLRWTNHGMWRQDADVHTYYSSELVTRYEQGDSFESGTIHVSFPITAPKYNDTTFADVPYSGADAVDKELPYWGLPNGVEGYAEMFVQIKNNVTDEIFTKEITSIDEPLMLKDCPFLIQDSIRMEINVSEILSAFPNNGTAFNGGDEVEISAMVFWSTPARRTALWSFEEADNKQILCTEVNNFAMNDDPVEINGDGNSSVTVTWNEGAVKSTGGYMRLQRRNAADADQVGGGWLYIDDNGTTTAEVGNARVWFNQDTDGDGIINAISFTDNDLPHSTWECQRVEYRVEQEMCAALNYTSPVGVNIIGTLENPWIVDGGISSGIDVSEGRYPFKVKIDWSTATDQADNIAQFRVYRRPYQPATPNAIAWAQIFSSEDFTWYIDQDIAAGTLYEYRVGAVMTCTTDTTDVSVDGTDNSAEGSANTTDLQEFFPPAPYPVGFRSSMGVVAGEILFENNAPSGNVRVNVTPQGTVNTRNSLELEENEYLKLDLNNLTENSAQVWPDIHSETPGDEWSISQWIQVPDSTVLMHDEFPLVSFNIQDPSTQAVNEAFSIWGNTVDAPEGHFDLKLKQAGTSLSFEPANIRLQDDTYYHINIQLSNGLVAPDFVVGVTVLSDTSSTALPVAGELQLNGTAESLTEMRAGWHSITWNAAGASLLACGDPFAENFAPLAISTNQDACVYGAEEDLGCSDPMVAAAPAGYDAHPAEEAACDYSSLSYGELITVRWFSDASASPAEAPAIFRMTPNGEELFWNFHGDLQSVHAANPVGYPYSMPVLSKVLPEGNYRVRVLDNGLIGQPDAANFSGNFSVHNDRGVEYVNCIQYLTSEVNEGVYDFTISGGGCDLTSTPGMTLSNLMTDCADCYSLSFDSFSTPYELSTTDAGQTHIGNTPTFTFWFRAPHQPGPIFKAINANSQAVELQASVDNADPTNTGGIRFELMGPNEQFLVRSVAAPYNEYNLIPGQWYHATLHLGVSGTGSFILRSTNLNDGDAEPWNSTREFTFGQGTVNTPYNDPSGFPLSRLELGGADILLHSLSIWSEALSKAQSLEVYDGITSDQLYNPNSGFTNIDGLWNSNPAESNLDFSKLRSVLIPDNSGRLVDHMAGKQLYPSGYDAGLSGTETFQVATPSATGMSIGDIADSRRSIRRAPFGMCNPGCSRISNACNFNPFANQLQDCQLACAGVTAETSELVSHPVNYDEIRGWTGAPYHVLNEDARINQNNHPNYQQDYLSAELANFWGRRYPDNRTPGLFLMYDLDEGLGAVTYDRSKFAEDADGWNHNNGQLMKQITVGDEHTQVAAAPGDMYYSAIPHNLPQTLGNWALSSEINGTYIVPNVKYQGASSMFDVEANKSSDGFPHTFQPGMQVALVGDLMLASENRDFTDVSAFEVDIDVVYQDIPEGASDYSGIVTPIASDCPVKGVRFKVDGVVAKDENETPLETDAQGRVRLNLTRGNHLIVPMLDHLDEASSEDDHDFYLASGDGNVVLVEGPMLRTASGAPFTMIDITTRRAVGKVIGGEEQAAKAWDAATNNMGIARFQLVKEYGMSGSPVTELAQQCPAVQVTTDLHGQYDVELLPGQYRIATSFDNVDPTIATWSRNSFTGFTVEGWMGNAESTTIGNSSNTWITAFPQHIKDNGSGGYSDGDVSSYSIWDMTTKQSWDQGAAYPSQPNVEGTTYTPSDAYARVDLIFNPSVELTVNQLDMITNDAGEVVCANDNPRALNASLGPVFLGEKSLTVKNGAGVEYISPMMQHLMAHKTGVEDDVVNDIDLVPPFPLGLPLIKMGTQYCSAIKAIRKYDVSLPAMSHEVKDTTVVKGEQYTLSIQNTLADPQFVSTIALANEDAGTAYGFAGAAPSYDPIDLIPRGFMQIRLLENGQEKATWNPFAGVMGNNPNLSEVPGLMKSSDQSILLQNDRFDAILMGEYISAPPVPISSDPELDFILRDPPGDQSFCSIEQGSTFSFEKTIESGNQHSQSRDRNIEVIPAIDLGIELAFKPLGFGVGSSAGFTLDAEWGVGRQETYSKSSSGEQTIREEISAVETISTSMEEQSGIYGNNQDLYYGTVRNTAIGFTKHHKMVSVEEALGSSTISGMLTSLDLPVDNAPVYYFSDPDGDGVAEYPMFWKKAADGSIDPSNAAYFTFQWSTIPSKTLLPASYFMKTEYTIENVDIPVLEAARDSYFKNSGFYQHPDGQPASRDEGTAPGQLGWSYPKGMRYANNDDHRWELFHQTYLTERNTADPEYPAQASTLQKGYNDNADIFSGLDPSSTVTNAGGSISDGTEGFDAAYITRLQAEATTGDDRVGPGYRFAVTAAQLEAVRTEMEDPSITDIQLDSVRYYNNQIAAWKLMLARNEFEKLNARKYIMDNVETQFSNPDQLSTWIEDLEASSAEVNNWSVNDFSAIAVENGNLQGGELGADNSIWDDADFEPFFLNFSGGGAAYTSSLTKTNITEVTSSKTLSGVWSGTEGGGLLVGGAGLVASEGEETVITETRKNTEGTASSVNYTYHLSDDDEQDFYLVCVVPGKGLDGPMFLNLGSATSCPWVEAQPSQYSEWYAALLPTQYNLNAPIAECSAINTPVWNSSLDVSTLTLSTTQGSAFHAFDQQTYDDETISIATGNSQTNDIAAALGTTAGIMLAVTAGAAAPLSIGLLGYAAVFASMGAIEEAVASNWRTEVWEEYGDEFTQQGYSAADLATITLATEQTDLFIANGMCDIITEQDATVRAENTIVQPKSAEIEKADLTVTHDGNDGLESVNITQLMTEGINLSFQMKHMAPEPWGGPSKYYLFNDATNTTLAANVSLAGGDPLTDDYLLYPNWSNGAYTVLGSVEHNGIEDTQYMNGHIDFIMRSSCDIKIADTVRVNINYEPACSGVTLTAPLDNWTANLDLIESGDYSSLTGDLALHVDVERNEFKNWGQDTVPIVVQYRTGNGTDWLTMSPASLTTNADSTMSDVDFTWNPLHGSEICNLHGGACLGYEGPVLLRANSVCENEFAVPQYSPVVTGHVDFIRPELFGSVLPADGFYGPGDEIMLRWNEPMATTDPSEALNTENIEMWAVQNSDYTLNTGGLQFSGQEHLTVLQASNLDAAGWTATWRLHADMGASTSITPGVVFCQGDHNTGSLSVELRNAEQIAVVYRAQGQVINETVLSLPTASNSDSDPNWLTGWNQFELNVSPNGANLYDVNVDLNRTGTEETGTLNIPNFNLPSRRLTIGNGWTQDGAATTPLTLPIQNFRLWSSQKEEELAANDEFIITGQELGLQVFLPLDEMGGTPVERSRNRPIIMEANWFGTHEAAALDFAGNSGALRPQFSGQGFSSVGGKNTTVEFWMKPGGTNEAILGINGSAAPSMDTDMQNWSFEINGTGQLIVANGTDTLKTAESLTDAWHHVALVRHNNGSVNLYLDGDNVDSGAPNSHGTLQPLVIFLGARQSAPDSTDFTGDESAGDALSYDMPFTGKFDELRVWSTALPLNTIRERMRDGVYGYDNLVVHAPFEARGSGDDGIAATQFYSYSLWDGYVTSNDDGSLGMPSTFTAQDIVGLSESDIQTADAPLMQFEPQQVMSLPGDVASVSWNSLSDEVIVELNENVLYKYEDQLVTFKIDKSDLRDAAGNTVADDLTFNLLIDRNPLKWGEDDLSISGLPTSDLVMETTVMNVGNESKYFEITGLPSWIEVSPASGNINANSSVDVTFTVTSILPAGEYAIDAQLKGGLPCGGSSGFCYAERLTMSLDLFLEAPELNLDPAMYSSSIPMIAKVFKGNIASSNDRDIVMAYIGDELRGYAQLDMVVADQNLAFLTVFFDEVADANANVTFRVWDAASGVIRALVEPHWPNLDSDPISIQLDNDNPPPFSVFEPLLLRSTDKVEVQSELTPGWNWVSVNVVNVPGTSVQSAFQAVKQDDIIQIKAHDEDKIYFSSGTWMPDAQDSISPNMRYEVEMKAGMDTTWTMRNIGSMADHLTYTQNLHTGWNDLGYVPQQVFAVEDALVSLADVDTILGFNDLITSRYDGFAVHVGDGEWVGSLETLEPGQGYRLYLDDADGSAPAGTLEWPASFAYTNPGFRMEGPASDGQVVEQDAEEGLAGWPMNVQELESSMAMIIRLELPSNHVHSTGDVIGAFALDQEGNEICVGQVLPKDTEAGLLYFLSVFKGVSTSSELTFRWKSGLSEVELVADEMVAFRPSSLKGEPTSPFILHFTRADMDVQPSAFGGLVAYPNPFADELTIHWHGDAAVKSLSINDANGRLVSHLDCDGLQNGPCRWNATQLERGVYFIHAVTDEGRFAVRIVK